MSKRWVVASNHDDWPMYIEDMDSDDDIILTVSGDFAEPSDKAKYLAVLCDVLNGGQQGKEASSEKPTGHLCINFAVFSGLVSRMQYGEKILINQLYDALGRSTLNQDKPDE